MYHNVALCAAKLYYKRKLLRNVCSKLQTRTKWTCCKTKSSNPAGLPRFDTIQPQFLNYKLQREKYTVLFPLCQD